MPLTLMYITNRPEVAAIAQRAGVDRIWIDMEYIGKEERQAGMNTVKSYHTIEDIRRLRPIVNSSELMVRINPIHSESQQEIDATVKAGADIIMLPMFKSSREVAQFLELVNGRSKTILLVETAEAVANIEDILTVCNGNSEIHIGLNDLHLSYHQTFMFELLCDGTVERLCDLFRQHHLKYGFGGIARVGYGELPAEMIMTEHYRLSSTMAILSRGFCNANATPDVHEIENIFIQGVTDIRRKEQEISTYSSADYLQNKKNVATCVSAIVNKIKKRNE